MQQQNKKLTDTLNTENLDGPLTLSKRSSEGNYDEMQQFEMQTKSKFHFAEDGGCDDPSPLRPGQDLQGQFFLNNDAD